MLQIKDLSAGYGGPIIIHDVNLHINEGEIVTIIGPNGAGKSTILRSIFGITKIASGSISMGAEDLTKLKTSSIVKRGICYVPQGRSVFGTMTVEENLEMGAFIRSDREYIEKKS